MITPHRGQAATLKKALAMETNFLISFEQSLDLNLSEQRLVLVMRAFLKHVSRELVKFG